MLNLEYVENCGYKISATKRLWVQKLLKGMIKMHTITKHKTFYQILGILPKLMLFLLKKKTFWVKIYKVLGEKIFLIN